MSLEDAKSALKSAVLQGDVEMAKCLIEDHDINVNTVFYPPKQGLGVGNGLTMTLLYAAITARNVEMVEMLLEAEANPLNLSYDPRAARLQTDLIVATSMRSLGDADDQVFKIARQVRDAAYKFELIEAVTRGDMQLIDYVAAKLENSVGVNYLDKNRNRTALMAACDYGSTRAPSVEIVRRLLELGADPNAVNDAGATALHCAARDGIFAICDVLMEAGASVHKRDIAGQTPLDIVPDRHPDLRAVMARRMHDELAAAARKSVVLQRDLRVGRPLRIKKTDGGAP